MNVLLEINPLENPKRTGIATYIYYLVEALLKAEAPHHFRLWGPDVRTDPFPDLPQKRFDGNKLVSREVLEALRYTAPIGLIPKDVDLYHVLYTAYPAKRKNPATRLAATVYDLAFAYYPESITEPNAFRRLADCIPEQVGEADHVFTISESCKQDMISILQVPPEKISVVYPGVDLAAPAAASPEIETALREAGVPSNYILCVGTWEPRKNLPTLFRALHLLLNEMETQNISLVMTGLKGWKYSEAEALIERLGLADRIVTLGHVPRAWLPVLYSRARLFAYPSMYEGFGMPVVEAMACGAPVVTTNVSSLPEAAGNAGLQVAPHSPEEMASAIRRVLTEPGLREQMQEAGFTHARKFSWAAAARQMLKAYEAI